MRRANRQSGHEQPRDPELAVLHPTTVRRAGTNPLPPREGGGRGLLGVAISARLGCHRDPSATRGAREAEAAVSDEYVAALAECPELIGLFRLLEVGWLPLPLVYDEHGELTELRAYREWPDHSVDAIRVRSARDAAAMRINAESRPAMVWECEGTLVEVAAGALALPAPGSPGAPSLVIGSAPRLWTPGAR